MGVYKYKFQYMTRCEYQNWGHNYMSAWDLAWPQDDMICNVCCDVICIEVTFLRFLCYIRYRGKWNSFHTNSRSNVSAWSGAVEHDGRRHSGTTQILFIFVTCRHNYACNGAAPYNTKLPPGFAECDFPCRFDFSQAHLFKPLVMSGDLVSAIHAT